MMICRKCGKQAPEGMRFCGYCGAELVRKPEQPSASPWSRPATRSVHTEAARPGAPSTIVPKHASRHNALLVPDPEPVEDVQYDEAEDTGVYEEPDTYDDTNVYEEPDTYQIVNTYEESGEYEEPDVYEETDAEYEEPAEDEEYYEESDDEPFIDAPVKKRRRRSRSTTLEEKRRNRWIERNIGGMVGVVLTLVTLVALAVWLFLLPSGQMMLARFGLTQNASAYAGIAESAYSAGNYASAARSYYQALLLDNDNYEYAILTAQSYIDAGSNNKAATALTMAISINASDIRAYQMLKQLYPDSATRPVAVRKYLEQGATLTGDATLKE